jgi:hypothetical protein
VLFLSNIDKAQVILLSSGLEEQPESVQNGWFLKKHYKVIISRNQPLGEIMNFVGGTSAVRTFFEELAKDSLLVSPYTDKWIKTNFKKSKPNPKLDNGEIIFINASRFYGERLAKLLKIFPKFSSGFSTEYTITNTDFIAINLRTQQIILMGLGRRDQIHVRIYHDGKFEYVNYSEVEEFVNDDFETISESDKTAKSLNHQYLQKFCELDRFCLVVDLFESLYYFGVSSFEFANLPHSMMDIDEARGNGPNEDGIFEIDGEELSEEDLDELESSYEEAANDCKSHIRKIQLLFPKIDEGDLITGAY